MSILWEGCHASVVSECPGLLYTRLVYPTHVKCKGPSCNDILRTVEVGNVI